MVEQKAGLLDRWPLQGLSIGYTEVHFAKAMATCFSGKTAKIADFCKNCALYKPLRFM
jgi:hypothetical protein